MMASMTPRRALSLTLALLIVAGAALAWIHHWVHRHDDRIVAGVEALHTESWPRPRVAVVFGASVYRNGELSPLLEDRVETAIALYRARKVDRILVSGDNRHPSYNEPSAMREYLVSHAVAPRDVIVDYAGRSTYETCLRAREIFGLERAVLVTQGFHLPRALYLAHELGLDAAGVATDPGADRSFSYQSARELGAEVKAFLNVYLWPPKAMLGERESIK
jgi:SanA protein